MLNVTTAPKTQLRTKAATVAPAAAPAAAPIKVVAAPAAAPVKVVADTAAAPVKVVADTALVVGGTSFPTMSQEMMKGLTNTFANTLVNVPYPAAIKGFFGNLALGDSVAAGADTLVAMAKDVTASGKKVVLWGISQGALVVDAAARALATDPNRPAHDAITLVRVADPATAGTGFLNFLGPILSLWQKVNPSLRKPAESPFDSIVVVNQYDGFADFPNKLNPIAALNAIVGLVYRHGQTATVDLAGVPAKNVTTSVNSLGATTTTYLVPAKNLPLTQPLRDLGVPAAWVDGLDGFLRPMIEAGYDRPGTTPARASATRPAATPGRIAQRKRAA